MEVIEMLSVLLEQQSKYLAWRAGHPALVESYEDNVSADEVTITIRLKKETKDEKLP